MRAKRAKAIRAAGASPAGVRRRTSRNLSLPAPPVDRTLDYADRRPELKGIERGEKVLAVEQLEGLQMVVRPWLDRIDATRTQPRPGEGKRRGRAATYDAIDYWRLELLRRAIGARSTEGTRDWLTTDKAAATRRLIGFNVARPHFGGKARKYMSGIPSDGWMSDPARTGCRRSKLAQLVELLERWALAEKLRGIPGILDECRLLYADGSKAETHATPPKTRNGVVVNAKHVTAPDAGFVPNTGSNADHAGCGCNILFITTAKRTVLAHRRVPLSHSGSKTLTDMVTELGQVLDQLHTKALRVLSSEAAFNSRELRRELQAVGVLENIHLSRHGNENSGLR
jgi:hypothetical protein